MQCSPSPRSAQGERDHTVRGVCGDGNVRPIERTAPDRVEHYRRPVERPFLASERGRVTVLFGGLTGAHDRLIQSVFESCGYRAQALPQADLDACHIGRQYCNNGLCNPAYFTIGTLLRHLQQLEASGLARPEIVDRFVFFTASSCGPCRFGMYESEYRLALRNAGFEGFRVLVFQQDHGLRADTGEPGLKFTLHFGLAAANAMMLADALQASGSELRPYETTPGATDARLADAQRLATSLLAGRREAHAAGRVPRWLLGAVGTRPADILLRIYDNLYGAPFEATVRAARASMDSIAVDRLRVKPVVKITGEFWAQTTEGDGNFRMFRFLEHEGAHVLVEPVGGWLLYLLQWARAGILARRGLRIPPRLPRLARLRARLREDRGILGRWLLIEAAERIYRSRYDRIRGALGVPHRLLDQRELVRLAEPYYRQFARGGEGHLEVGKNIHYTTHRAAHMVLSLKPFGCMPSTQSDGVQASLLARFPDMLFLPIETGAEGELAAQSRVQIALVEARARAQEEFQEALAHSGRSLEEIRAYVADHPALSLSGYHVPHRPGVAGVAATFVLHVSDLMARRGGARVRPPAGARSLRSAT
jgi:predicted nucleotide-binding protein (sugar kinase/HSP70/actin superfamily)